MKTLYEYCFSEIPAIGNDELKLEARIMELENKGYRCEARDIMIDGRRTGFEIKTYKKIQIA
jgi:hypothetical protein